ncbi:hypothetical protein [Bdellovibrio sp. ArHS]|uniref:hypothetical protein n=1 Tax=Bdellovibrio sp. ArHS TaxID=1569284 RepID=UPI000AFA4386|nr:hypothetical protein [Bdellovibrio sp. ArHS]
MALETLKGINKVNGSEYVISCEIGKMSEPRAHIHVIHDYNQILFTLQNGPVKEVGVNGCQVVDMIAVAKHIIEKLNEKFPSSYNEDTIKALGDALDFQEMRTLDRKRREVEGLSKA